MSPEGLERVLRHEDYDPDLSEHYALSYEDRSRFRGGENEHDLKPRHYTKLSKELVTLNEIADNMIARSYIERHSVRSIQQSLVLPSDLDATIDITIDDVATEITVGEIVDQHRSTAGAGGIDLLDPAGDSDSPAWTITQRRVMDEHEIEQIVAARTDGAHTLHAGLRTRDDHNATLALSPPPGGCPRNTHLNDMPFPCGYGLGTPHDPDNPHAPGSHDPHNPRWESVDAPARLWNHTISQHPEIYGITNMGFRSGGGLAEQREYMLRRCLFRKMSHGSGAHTGFGIMPVYCEHTDSEGNTYSQLCNYTCDPSAPLFHGTPSAWLDAFKRERYFACWVEGPHPEIPHHLLARCNRPVARLHRRAELEMEPQWLRYGRGPEDLGAEATLVAIRRQSHALPPESEIASARASLAAAAYALINDPTQGNAVLAIGCKTLHRLARPLPSGCPLPKEPIPEKSC